MVGRLATTTPLLLCALLLAGCAGARSTVGDVPLEGLNSLATPSVVIPNAPAGDNLQRGAVRAPGSKTPLTREQATRIVEQRRCAAESIWKRAESLEAKNPGAAAELYESIFKSYPDYEMAAEARFREGRARTRIRDCDDAAAALKDYMRIAPVNPHLAEVEELLYESGKCGLASNTGFLSIFQSDDASLDALKFLAAAFPTGEYADDALLLLGDYYKADEDYATAALTYKELLVRYPDSEWSFKARLKLADTYLARDQGDDYDAGFLVLDPRELVPAEQAKMTAPIDSAVGMALEQYEIYLERMEADPGRMGEYACDVAYARKMRDQCRERIAAKDLFRGDWYRSRGCAEGAAGFYREAQRWTGTCAASTATARLAALGPVKTERTRAPCAPPPIQPAATPSVSAVPPAVPAMPRTVPAMPRAVPGMPPPPPPPPVPVGSR